MYPFGLIGNCQIAALVSREGSLDWLCLPRPDSPPVFGRLLDGAGGHFSITAVGAESHHQEYIRNTNVLVTTVTTKSGDQFRITDFCPRFSQFGRMFRPFSVFRIVEPLKGQPQIKVECQPVVGWEKEPVASVRGSSHLRFDIRGDSLRLWSSMPMTYLAEAQPFALTEKTYFALSWSSSMEENLAEVSEDFLRQTIDYWRNWVRHCSIPSEYQSETIRSALALKLHCYEDTGAILAALTTSLPEEVGGTRNWDYRFCWLRDASFVLNAFHQLGHFEEMEGFLKFLISVVKANEDARERMRPVYSLDRSVPLPEQEHLNWAGWDGRTSPVRSKNQAAEHVQNDVYGEMLVALAPIFLDERFYHLRTPENEEMIERLAAFCVKNISKPDAGLWELRDGWREHSFSNLLCWAGIDRAISIRNQGFLKSGLNLEKARAEAEASVRRAAFDGAVGNGPEDPTMDASLLFLPLLRFPDKEINRATVLKIEEELTFILDGKRHEGFLYRYLRKDDFGRPQSAFLICSYWLVQALARVGEKDRARKIMDKLSVSANSIGLLAEHFEPGPNKQLGNFPQAYSHTGQILAAFAVSRPWEEVL